MLVDVMRIEWSVSIRRACGALRFDPKSYRYKSRRPGQAALQQRIREICQTRIRFGYRRVHVLLRRDGWEVNPKRIYRLYKETPSHRRGTYQRRHHCWSGGQPKELSDGN